MLAVAGDVTEWPKVLPCNSEHCSLKFKPNTGNCIKGSNPFVSAKKQNAPYETCAPRGFFFVRWILKVRLSTRRDERMLGGSLL